MNASCPDTHRYRSSGGIIKSPAYPACYPVNQTCTWKLSAPMGFEVMIDPFTYQIYGSSSCSYDYLKIYDDDNNTTLCGAGRYFNYAAPLTAGPNLFIEFNSVNGEEAPGFQFRVFVIGMKIF